MKKIKQHPLAALLSPAAALLGLLWVLGALSGVEEGQQLQQRQHLEESVRRAAVTCYAVEGIYPPNVDYLQEHYGLQINRGRFRVMYEVHGSNLMPDITVLEMEP